MVEHNEPNYTLDIEKGVASRAGVWASFLQTRVGDGGDVSGEVSRETAEQWRCANLQTLSFTPKLEYIMRCLEHQQYDKGAMLGLRGPEEGDSDEMENVVVEGVDNDDADGSDLGLVDQEAVDDSTADGVPCTVAVAED